MFRINDCVVYIYECRSTCDASFIFNETALRYESCAMCDVDLRDDDEVGRKGQHIHWKTLEWAAIDAFRHLPSNLMYSFPPPTKNHSLSTTTTTWIAA